MSNPEDRQRRPEFDGKVCVVTGGGRGIGAAIAARFAAEGARVAILEQDPVTGEETAKRLLSEGAEARFYQLDVKDEEAVVSVASRVINDFGGADILVNNAGISRLGPSMTYPLEDWEDSLGIMATGVFLCSREFGKSLRARGGGVIVNVASINGLIAFPMRLAYSAAKAAVISMTRVLAVEWAGYGIRVNAVAPGMTSTQLTRKGIEDGLINLDTYRGRTPLGRLAEPAEMADAVAYLASERSSFVTGHVLVSDGGWSAFAWVPWSGDPEAPDIGS